MLEAELAAELKSLVEQSGVHGVDGCDTLPTENGAFAIDMEWGERFVVIVQQVTG